MNKRPDDVRIGRRMTMLPICGTLVASLVVLAIGAGCDVPDHEASEATTEFLSPGPDGLTAEEGGPVSATICVKHGEFSCYCSGVGCRKFCKDILILGMGGSNSEPVAVGNVAGYYPAYPTPSIGSQSFTGDVALVAAVGNAQTVEAGRGRIIVKARNGATLFDRTAGTAEVRIGAAGQSVTADFLFRLLDADRFTIDLEP